MPESRLETVGDKPVLLLRRFDRYGGNRIPFLSSMSMLGAKDFDHDDLRMARRVPKVPPGAAT